MAHLQVFAFGKLHMQRGEEVVASFPTRHVEELLAYFLLNQQVHHPREKLIDILWPYGAPNNARGRLSTVLWRLRAQFNHLGATSDAYLHSARDWISFAPEEPLLLDAQRFEQKLGQAQKQPQASSQQEEALRAAVNVYQGELYEGIYADWCLMERERYARLYLRALGQLMACLIQQQAYEEAVALGQQILQHEPLREEVHRAVMHCFWQMGQAGQAARQFEKCRRLLLEELQAPPMAETVNLYQTITTDRLLQANGGTAADDAYRRQLQQAFAEFEEAGRRLNELLDKAG